MRTAALLVLALLVGCAPAEMAVVVVVACERRVGDPDCRTYVETSDGVRHFRPGRWGEVGDSLRIRRTIGDTWRNP